MLCLKQSDKMHIYAQPVKQFKNALAKWGYTQNGVIHKISNVKARVSFHKKVTSKNGRN